MGDPAVAFDPRHSQFLNGAVAVLELGDARLDERLELAGVQMPPLAFRPAIDVGAFGRIRRVGPYLPSLEDNLNYYSLILQRKGNMFNRPRRFNSEKLFVQCGVFHVVGYEFRKRYSRAVRENSQ